MSASEVRGPPTAEPRGAALARCLDAAGGMGVDEALQRAAVALETVREAALATLDEAMTGVGLACCEASTQAGALPGASSPEVLARLHRLNNTIAGVAGTFGLAGLGHAARSFCDLVETIEGSGVWDGEAAEVHLAALRMLRSGATPPAEEASMVDGLTRVVARLRATTSAG